MQHLIYWFWHYQVFIFVWNATWIVVERQFSSMHAKLKWWGPGQKQMKNLMSAKPAAFLLAAIRGKCLYPTTFHIWHTHDTKEVSGWAFRVNLRFLCEFHVWPFCPHRSSRLHGCFWRKWLSENILTFFWGKRIVSDACKADLGSDFNFFTSRATHNGYDDILNFFRPSPLCSCAFQPAPPTFWTDYKSNYLTI